MKSSKKYKSGVLGALAGVALLSLGTVAMADTLPSTGTTGAPKMMVNIGPNGVTSLSGSVVSVGTNTLTVKSWGGNWYINTGSGTTVLPSGTTVGDVSGIKVGDAVSVKGTTRTTASWTIDAKSINDGVNKPKTGIGEKKNGSEKPANVGEKGKTSNHQVVIGKNYVGTASNITASSLTLTSNGTVYTVNISSSTNVQDKTRHTLALNAVQANDNLRVYGVLTGTTIAAQVVHDTTR